jgi:hypothetical protein
MQDQCALLHLSCWQSQAPVMTVCMYSQGSSTRSGPTCCCLHRLLQALQGEVLVHTPGTAHCMYTVGRECIMISICHVSILLLRLTWQGQHVSSQANRQYMHVNTSCKVPDTPRETRHLFCTAIRHSSMKRQLAGVNATHMGRLCCHCGWALPPC